MYGFVCGNKTNLGHRQPEKPGVFGGIRATGYGTLKRHDSSGLLRSGVLKAHDRLSFARSGERGRFCLTLYFSGGGSRCSLGRMTNSFPILTLITVLTTNWVNNGDFKRESGTNWIAQRQVVVTNTYVQEVALCTNRTLYKRTESAQTNAPVRWTRAAPPPLPTLPGQFEKP